MLLALLFPFLTSARMRRMRRKLKFSSLENYSTGTTCSYVIHFIPHSYHTFATYPLVSWDASGFPAIHRLTEEHSNQNNSSLRCKFWNLFLFYSLGGRIHIHLLSSPQNISHLCPIWWINEESKWNGDVQRAIRIESVAKAFKSTPPARVLKWRLTKWQKMHKII